MYSPFFDVQYTDRPGPCPVCGATGQCPDTPEVAMPHPPVDFAEGVDQSGPLRGYAVTVHGFTTTMQLNDSDADRYGDAAVLIA